MNCLQTATNQLKWLSVFGLVFGFAAFSGQNADAQNFQPAFNQTVQLPVLSFFNVRTVVSVPDGGSMSIGGVNRHRSSSRSSGIPGTPFVNRARGFENRSSHMVVKPRIIINSELEADLLAEAERRISVREKADPNGPVAVQNKADFISRNVGRKTRR